MSLLKSWLTRVLHDKTWSNFDDYHVSELNQTRDKAEWIKKLFECLGEAINFRNELSADLIIVLGVSLKSGRKYRGSIAFESGGDIMKEATKSPPSIYAFPKDFDYLVLTVQKSIRIENLKGVPKDFSTLYLEYLPEGSDEFRRSILFIKNDDLKRISLPNEEKRANS